MDSVPVNNAPGPEVGLPPVKPPSGRFIAQLFVIPGLIILVAVGILIGLSLLVRRVHEPAYFLSQLDSDNHDVRWRGMSELAQVMKRTEPEAQRWKADLDFAVELTDRLDRTFAELKEEEQQIDAEIAKSADKDKELLWRRLREKRDYAIFLAGAVAEFDMPVAAPVLCAMIRHDASPDLKGNTLQRRKALWALMNMGQNSKAFAGLPAEERTRLFGALKQTAERSDAHGLWARTALYYLDQSVLSSAQLKGVVKVDETLAFAADADDRFLRELTAMAFNFWDGALAEPTLLKLANDRGQGTLLRVEEND